MSIICEINYSNWSRHTSIPDRVPTHKRVRHWDWELWLSDRDNQMCSFRIYNKYYRSNDLQIPIDRDALVGTRVERSPMRLLLLHFVIGLLETNYTIIKFELSTLPYFLPIKHLHKCLEVHIEWTTFVRVTVRQNYSRAPVLGLAEKNQINCFLNISCLAWFDFYLTLNKKWCGKNLVLMSVCKCSQLTYIRLKGRETLAIR